MTVWPDPWAVLLDKARGDERMLACLLSDLSLPDWGVGFHAQQAAEKALKAVLAHRQVRFPFTHDLEGLLELISERGIALPPDANELPRLTPFGARMRYEELLARSLPPFDAAWARRVVRQTIEWAERMITVK